VTGLKELFNEAIWRLLLLTVVWLTGVPMLDLADRVESAESRRSEIGYEPS